MLEGSQIILRSAMAFDESEYIKEIIIVTRQQDIAEAKKIIGNRLSAFVKYTSGGATRRESVLRGLNMLDKRCTHVAVHDGARPLITKDTIDNVIKTAIEKGAASAACAAVDTISVAEEGILKKTLNRKNVFHMQTPQAFERSILEKAHMKANQDGYEATDDASVVMRTGQNVYIVCGSSNNIKITEPRDMLIAEAIIKSNQGG